MSKFIDKLKKVSTVVSPPIGFRSQKAPSPKPNMLLVAALKPGDISDAKDIVSGADAGLLIVSNASSGLQSLQKVTESVPDIPWGIRLEGEWNAERSEKLAVDFVVFPLNTHLTRFQGDDVGKVLVAEATLNEGLLRTINELPVGAVVIENGLGDDEHLTWQHLLLFRRFADLLSKPILVMVPTKISPGELQALSDAGVKGVIVAAGEGQLSSRLMELRQSIDKLVPVRKQSKIAALLPRMREGTSEVAEEEGDEGDEGDEEE